MRTARPEPDGPSWMSACRELLDRLDGAADDAQLAADLLPHEDQGDDGDDRDKRKDECVFGETLAVVFSPRVAEPRGNPPELGHVFHLLPSDVPNGSSRGRDEAPPARPTVGRVVGLSIGPLVRRWRADAPAALLVSSSSESCRRHSCVDGRGQRRRTAGTWWVTGGSVQSELRSRRRPSTGSC